MEGLVSAQVPEDVGVEPLGELLGRGEGTSSDHASLKDGEPALDLVEPRCVLGREVSGPTRVLVEPLVDVGRVVGGQVVHHEVPAPGRVAEVHEIEQVDEGIAVVVAGGEAEGATATHVECTHPAERAVTDVFELAAHRLPGLHGDVRVAALDRLDARPLIEADNVLVGGRLVVEAQHVIALLAKLLVVRRQVHLLAMRLKVGVVQDAPHGAVADLDPLLANVLAEQRFRPVRDRHAYIFGWTARLGLDARGVGVREREGGRPERGASASVSAGCSASKRRRHSCTVRMCTPTARAMSVPGTASAIISRAVARRTIRCSAVAGRMAASTLARSSAESTSGTVGRPPCRRCANAA